jgi:hypothetical protein
LIARIKKQKNNYLLFQERIKRGKEIESSEDIGDDPASHISAHESIAVAAPFQV